MSKQKKPKATMQEVTTTIDQMLSNMSWLKSNLDMIGRLFDLYVESKGDTDTFKEFLDARQKAYEDKEAEAAKNSKEEANEQPADEPSDEADSGVSGRDEK